MSIDKIKQKLIQNSLKDSDWLAKAQWRQDNEVWLDISFSIAVKVASILSANKKTNTSPKSQVELAEALGCSAQYVNKLLRGKENLQIETICKIGRILGVKLIEVPKVEAKSTSIYEPAPLLVNNISLRSEEITTSANYSKLKVLKNYESAA